MTDANTTTAATTRKQSNPFMDLIFSIAIPSFILLKFSGEDDLGATQALLVALAFPIGWGIFSFFQTKSVKFIALLGLVSVALTGGIGLFKLDPFWLAVKEASIPALIGVAVLISTQTRYPLIKWLIYNPSIMNVEKIKERLAHFGKQKLFDDSLLKATYWLALTFVFSAVMNYVLARWIVNSPAGSEAFNAELAKMTLLSYPVIAIPSMIAMVFIIYYLWKSIHSMTGLEFEEILVNQEKEKQD